jgi:hypothetical protein
MMGVNSLAMAVRLLFLLPFLAIMGYGLLMSKFTVEMQEGKPGFATNVVMKLGIAWLGFNMDRQRDAVTDTATLTDERFVVLTRYATLVELGADPAALPKGERATLFAMAQAKIWGDAQCAVLIRTFADKCQMGSVSAGLRNDDTAVEMRVSLNFTDPSQIGSTAGLTDPALSALSVDLAEERITVARADADTARMELYAKARALCDQQRATAGTCVIEMVDIIEESAEDGTVKLRAGARLASLVDGSKTTAGAKGTAGGMGWLAEMMGAAPAAEPQGIGAEVNEIFKQTAEALNAATVGETGVPTAEAKRIGVPEEGGSVDGSDQPRFQNTKGSAKFVTAP